MKKISCIIVVFLSVLSIRAGEVLTIKDITARQFATTMKAGVNIGNSLDACNTDPTSSSRKRQGNGSSLESCFGNHAIVKADFDLIKSLGFTTVRIPVTWFEKTYYGSATTTANTRLHVYDEWMNRVKQVVDWAIEDNLQVVLNIHHEQPMVYLGTASGDAAVEQVYKDFHDLWIEIATAFRGYNEKLAFESCNEVAPKRGWDEQYETDNVMMQMNKLNQIFVNTVRATGGNNTQRVLVVPTIIDQTSSKALDAFILPHDQVANKLIVQVHHYGTAIVQDIEKSFTQLEYFSKQKNAPVMIGEFGTTASTFSPLSYRPYQVSNFVARFLAHGLCGTYWDEGNLGAFGIIDRRSNTVGSYNKEMVDAIINPVAYEANHITCFSSMDNFTYNNLDGVTGALTAINGWGGIVLGTTDNGVKIPDNATNISIHSVASGSGVVSRCKVGNIVFYDANMNIVPYSSTVNYAKGDGTYQIPSGAVYYRFSLNSAYYNISKDDFVEAFNDDDLEFWVSFYGDKIADWMNAVK